MFTINPTTGALSFLSAPNYESPGDADTDNIYVVTVEVTDGGTPVLTDTQTLSITVADVFESVAPTLTTSTFAFPDLTEDDTSDAGLSVSTILDGKAADANAGTVIGLALTSLTSTNGTWQYSLDNGSNWIPVGTRVEYNVVEDAFGNVTVESVFSSAGTVSNSNALLLRAGDKIRFVPNAENGGGGSFTFRAWDESSGFAGDYADASTQGAAPPFLRMPARQPSPARMSMTPPLFLADRSL